MKHNLYELSMARAEILLLTLLSVVVIVQIEESDLPP